MIAYVERLVTKTDKRISMATLKRLATKVRLRWKRVRKSLKHLRDPEAFAQCQRELAALQQQEDAGKIDLYSYRSTIFQAVRQIWLPTSYRPPRQRLKSPESAVEPS